MSYLGLDIGTTGCKAAVYDGLGKQLGWAYREYAIVSPQPGFAELDSAAVCEAALEVIAQAASAVPGDRVTAMCVSSQGEAFTAVDSRGAPLCNAMVSSDARAAQLASQWTEGFGAWKLYEITGHTAHPMFTVFKLLWLKQHDPEVWKNAAAFHCFEDLMHTRLGVTPAMSWPLAGRTMIFDITRHEWSDEVLEAAGIERSKLSRTLQSGAVVGQIPIEICQRLGLAPEAVVVAGGHDQTCATLGAGVASGGRAMYATGTVECICAFNDHPRFTRDLFESNLCTYDGTLRETYATVAFNLTGGNILKWFRDEFGQLEQREAARSGTDAYEYLLRAMPADPTRLLVLPYFAPSGTPYFDSETPGAVLGLRLDTSRGEVLRGLLEGVAFEMRLNIDILDRSGVEVDEFVASGGGAKSAVLNQLKADVTGRPIATVKDPQTGCLGAAILARSGLEGRAPGVLADEMVARGTTYEPDPSRSAFYSQRFETYREVYSAVRGLRLSDTLPGTSSSS